MSTNFTSATARLRWLVDLRWMALAGVTFSAMLATGGLVPGVNVEVTLVAVGLGVVTNLMVWRRIRSHGETDDRHIRQALLDTGALTLVIWAAGGAECPFIAFYVFPVLLAVLVGGAEALWPAGLASAAGLAFQFVSLKVPALQVGTWNPSPPMDLVLTGGAIILTVSMAAYFAFHLTHALRQQTTARQESDAMVRSAFDVLDAGIELIESRRVIWQNPEAESLFGVRTETEWICPDGRTDGSETREPSLDTMLDNPTTRYEIEYVRDGREYIYELLSFPVPGGQRTLVFYFDRTHHIRNQRRLMQTERLASLGRAVHGVAHELNTPLATIQTLSRDVLDVINQMALTPVVRADLTESADIIVEEVQRCRRITHALLGRAEPLDTLASETTTIAAAVDRAVTVVFPKKKDRVSVDLGAVGQTQLPFDPLVQIFVNLLQNARDAQPNGHIDVVGRATSPPRVEVLDVGPGLTAEAERHLFEPFFSTKSPGQGTGLGLYTSYALAKSFGGDLTLTNRAGGGAIAAVILPQSNHLP